MPHEIFTISDAGITFSVAWEKEKDGPGPIWEFVKQCLEGTEEEARRTQKTLFVLLTFAAMLTALRHEDSEEDVESAEHMEKYVGEALRIVVERKAKGF